MGHKESAQFYTSFGHIKSLYFLITKNRIVMDLPKPSTVISRAVISSSDWMKLAKLPKTSSAFIQTRVEMRLKFIIVEECQTLAMISNLTKQVGSLPGKENAWLEELMINLAQFLFKVSFESVRQILTFFSLWSKQHFPAVGNQWRSCPLKPANCTQNLFSVLSFTQSEKNLSKVPSQCL